MPATLRDLAWSQPSTYSATGVHHGYRTAPGTIDDLADMVGLVGVVKVWFGMLEPGGFIVPHIDASPWYRRWHYPLEPAGYVLQGDTVTESPSDPFEIFHYQPHAVWNPTDKRRVHMLVETDERIPGESNLVLCPMIAEIQGLIDGI